MNGPRTEGSYEARFGRLTGTGHAIAFAFARHGLVAVLRSSGLRPGDEVAVSALTCKVVPLALLSLRLKPVYVDVTESTLNLDPRRLEADAGPSTRAIVFQHTYGNAEGLDEAARIAAERGILLVEDRAQCLPSSRPLHLRGRAAIFSNNWRKPLPAGSGGVVVTDDTELAEGVATWRDGLPRRGRWGEARLRLERLVHERILRPALYWPFYDLARVLDPSYRRRPPAAEIESQVTALALRTSDTQEREGLRWLSRLNELEEHCRACCAEYALGLRGRNGLQVPSALSDRPLYYFPVITEKKQSLLRAARRRAIELIAWPVETPIYPIERQEDLAGYGYRAGSCPVAERLGRTLVGLPTHRGIGPRERSRILELLSNGHDR